jgi:hypothetical protein
MYIILHMICIRYIYITINISFIYIYIMYIYIIHYIHSIPLHFFNPVTSSLGSAAAFITLTASRLDTCYGRITGGPLETLRCAMFNTCRGDVVDVQHHSISRHPQTVAVGDFWRFSDLVEALLHNSKWRLRFPIFFSFSTPLLKAHQCCDRTPHPSCVPSCTVGKIESAHPPQVQTLPLMK